MKDLTEDRFSLKTEEICVFLFFFNTIHASALCNHLTSVSHWRHSPVAVPTLKELERRISTSTTK